MRAFVELWDEITRERYGVQDAKMRRFRYGVQVNSLGLTEAQPENNIQRIVLEMLGVTLSKNARARAVQLPAWNEALGLPRPWDQQWSLRLQQVLAFESDLLEYDDIFDGSHVVAAKVAELVDSARKEIDRVQALGGAIPAVESGYMKEALVSSHAARRARIESGEEKIVGVNIYETTEPSPLTADLDAAIMAADPEAEKTALASVEAWKAERDQGEVDEGAGPAGRGRQDRHQPDDRNPGRGPRRRDDGGVGRHAARGVRRVPGADRGLRRGRALSTVGSAGSALAAVRQRVKETGDELSGGRAAGCGCWSASPASTATRTAPSRSPSARATPASRSSTRASGSPRSRSWPRPWPRTCTAWASRSCPARTWSWSPPCSTG